VKVMGRNAVAAGVAALGLLVGTAACGDSKDHSKPSPLSAAQVCDEALSPAAAELEYVTGETEFGQGSSKSRLVSMAGQLADEFERDSSAPWKIYNFCLIYSEGSVDLADITFRFELTDNRIPRSSEMDPELDLYQIGRHAYAGEKTAAVSFECVSQKLDGSEGEPAIIRSSLRKRWQPDGAGRKYLDANMTMAHSAALAIAKELGCEGDGGLGAEPDLKPVS
jgi:hypothetical protein